MKQKLVAHWLIRGLTLLNVLLQFAVMESSFAFGLLANSQAQPASATTSTGPKREPDIHLVWMGGDDCPPCKSWRLHELPLLRSSPVFRAVRFIYVDKPVRSSVPPAQYLPQEIRPFKNKLDQASGGRIGSPQAFLLVSGEVYEFFREARYAADIIEMILEARNTLLRR